MRPAESSHSPALCGAERRINGKSTTAGCAIPRPLAGLRLGDARRECEVEVVVVVGCGMGRSENKKDGGAQTFCCCRRCDPSRRSVIDREGSEGKGGRGGRCCPSLRRDETRERPRTSSRDQGRADGHHEHEHEPEPQSRQRAQPFLPPRPMDSRDAPWMFDVAGTSCADSPQELFPSAILRAARREKAVLVLKICRSCW